MRAHASAERVMSLCGHAQVPDDGRATAAPVPAEETDARGSEAAEGIRLRDYRFINDNIREYFHPSDFHTSVAKGKFVSKLDVLAVTPPRSKILELLRPEDPGTDTLEAIVRPTPRRGLIRPYDEDTRRFLQRALYNTPNPVFASTPEQSSGLSASPEDSEEEKQNSLATSSDSSKERSLADELREAEEDENSGANLRRELLREFRKGGIREAMERDRLGKLALSVEDDEDLEECGLTAAARKLDALLEESRSLHEELAGIHEDIQVLARRVSRRDP